MAATHEDRNANLSPGVAIKAPCRAATTGAITLSGEQTIDAVACVAGDRVLVKNQTNSIANGIYGVSTGAWAREPDFDGNRDVVTGTFVFITSGATNAGAFYECTTTGTVVFGTSNITFAVGALGPIALPISGSNVTFTQSGTPTANSVAAKLQQIISVKDAPFNAVGDGVTDDTAAIQAALNLGGKILIGGKLTYKCMSANLTFVANTELWIEQGTTLWLSTIRLTALNVNDVQIHNHGIIKSTSLNTTDALPTNWYGRGIVEFGGTTASPVLRVGIDGPGTVFGDFVGTPGSTATTANDKRRGILFNNVKTAWAKFNNVYGTIAEGIWYAGANSPSNDDDIQILGNRVHDCNHDAISCANFAPTTVRITNNIGWNCLNGVETSIGEVRSNFMFSMVGGGYTFGGSSPPDASPPLIFADNTGLNNTTNDFGLQGASVASGILICQNNISINAGAFAFIAQFIKTAFLTGNKAYGWGTTAAGSGLATANNTLSIISGNAVVNENVAHSNGGYNISGATIWGVNNVSGVAVPYLGTDTGGQVLKTSAPTTQTGATYTVAAIDTSIIANRAGTVTLTLESAATVPGKMLTVRTIQAQTVVSASSNVVPLIGGAAGTAILAATAGKWAILVSDGTNWQIQAAN